MVTFGEHQVDFARWQRLSMREAITKYWPFGTDTAPTPDELARPGGPRGIAVRYNESLSQASTPPEGWGPIKIQQMTDGEMTGLLFETLAEPKLIQPTLLYDFPTDISPLAKCRDDDPSLVERFEVYVAGMELGNAFSE